MNGTSPHPGILAVLLVLTALSGCLGDDPGPTADPATEEDPDPYVPTEQGEKRASELTAADIVAAPTWQVGDWFGHHVYLQGGDPGGRHYNTAVVEETAEGWVLAPDDPEAAKEEAAWDLPVAGLVAPGLATTAYGAEWDLFRFPLQDGKTWDGKVQVRELRQYELYEYDAAFEVAFDPEIDVNGETLPGFRVTATTNGTSLVDASYIPAIRWYGHITVHDVRTENEDFFIKSVSMGYGTGWNGTYHMANGESVTETFGGFVAFAPQAMGPAAPDRFTVPDDADTLFGIVVAFAWGGASAVALVDPEGGLHEMHAAHANPLEDGQVALDFVDEPAMAGDWSIAVAGGGAVWVAGAQLFAFDMQEHTL